MQKCEENVNVLLILYLLMSEDKNINLAIFGLCENPVNLSQLNKKTMRHVYC